MAGGRVDIKGMHMRSTTAGWWRDCRLAGKAYRGDTLYKAWPGAITSTHAHLKRMFGGPVVGPPPAHARFCLQVLRLSELVFILGGLFTSAAPCLFYRLLFGSLHIKSYDWVGASPAAIGLGAHAPARLVMDRVVEGLADPLVLFPDSGKSWMHSDRQHQLFRGTEHVLSARQVHTLGLKHCVRMHAIMPGGNVHEFCSHSPCAVLDILIPRYEPGRGEQHRTYHIALVDMRNVMPLEHHSNKYRQISGYRPVATAMMAFGQPCLQTAHMQVATVHTSKSERSSRTKALELLCWR